MPSGTPDEPKPDEPRVVIDESTLDFRGLTDTQIEDGLDSLNAALQAARQQNLKPANPPMWRDVEVLDGCELFEFLSRAHPSDVDRDTLVLASSLLGNCPEWVDDGTVEMESAVDGAEPAVALSVGYAVSRAAAKRAVACLVFLTASRTGLLPVINTRGSASVYFFTEDRHLPEFWRWRMRFERFEETEFFLSCRFAFPDLAFHDELAFRHFEGSYLSLLGRVVDVLGTLNDHFLTAYRDCDGVPSTVQATLGAHHFDASMESRKTRSSDKLMRQREVQADGRSYRCEWHAKIEPHRNRIHFWVPPKGSNEPIFVGIFVMHLAT